MNSIHKKYEQRIADSYARIKDAYSYTKSDRMPFQISDVNYCVTGQTVELIPDDYFTNPQSMLRYQLAKIENHMERYDDDYIPFLFPWYGTGVVPSALGCNVIFQDKMDPVAGGAIIEDIDEIKNLAEPDPYKDGLMPKVIETIRYFRRHSDLPITFTDSQGPFNIALTLVGIERLFIWLYEYPAAVHELMDFCTEVFIKWVKVQKDEIGGAGRCCFPHGIILPEEFGSVWLSDDDCIAISAEQYKEFVVPYNGRIFKTFGGGTLHFCGTAEHQLENFLNTEGLVGLNNFCMGNFRQIYKMQDLFKDRLAVKVCDFAPLNISKYYTELMEGLNKLGTILATFVAPELALGDNGGYAQISRAAEKISDEAYEVIRDLVC
jgi:uroporphyrinogen-III decarboxylase